ncbi:MAG: hypothetical protein JETT_0462 [Candidatus Jettenia ecosi]|uniref:Metal-dependent hydrolase n=1 Tax=Candidatus Jettenia ecosi TaxID=2494326 RepID=A0A533QEV2_9BACT|nr:MAG: hypothetical protein JETT_0462 [Candidatus Jettenia ecosi]
MNFKGHIIGGCISGIAITAVKLLSDGSLDFSSFPQEAALIFGITVFFSIFPDLDTESIPQRWFYRAVFLLLLYLGYKKHYGLATLLAIVAITPKIDHHRGWTHHYFSAVLLPLFLAGFYEYVLAKNQSHDWPFYCMYERFIDRLWLVIACIIGWNTHLLLDSQLSLFKNNKRYRS